MPGKPNHILFPAVCALLFAAARAAQPVLVNDDGGWNWLQDRRAVASGRTIVAGSVATGTDDPARAGDVEATLFNPASGQVRRAALHHPTSAAERKIWKEDHNSPAFWVRPGGRVVAMYAEHSREARLYYRITEPGDLGRWGPERVVNLPAASKVACPNLEFLASENGGRGRLYAFFRGLDGKNMPSWVSSDDFGQTWTVGGILFTSGPGKGDTLPYVRYESDGRDTVHLVYTHGHQTSYHNALLYRTFRGGVTSAPTPIFQAGPDDVAWISDLVLDPAGHPCVAYTVQVNGPDRAHLGEDHRFRYARWDGQAWVDREIAYAGSRLHLVPADSCTGLIAIDPADPGRVFISTDADPRAGAPLVSAADHRRHWEMFEGDSPDAGKSWIWTALTRDSTSDNIRPVAPRWKESGTPVLWLRGAMRMPDDYRLAVVGLVLPKSGMTR